MILKRLFTIVWRFTQSTDGATMVEYGLLVALIALVGGAFVMSFGGNINTLFTIISQSLDSVSSM
jgi:pilus assembly protein Flp/PilA